LTRTPFLGILLPAVVPQDFPSRNKCETFSKESNRTMSLLKPFNGWDYILCAIAYFLIGIAAVPKLATLIFGH
jgi:hypothetical protein